MSEREQAQALKLLGELFKFAKAGQLPPADLLAKAESFLSLPVLPESHGQRRS